MWSCFFSVFIELPPFCPVFLFLSISLSLCYKIRFEKSMLGCYRLSWHYLAVPHYFQVVSSNHDFVNPWMLSNAHSFQWKCLWVLSCMCVLPTTLTPFSYFSFVQPLCHLSTSHSIPSTRSIQIPRFLHCFLKKEGCYFLNRMPFLTLYPFSRFELWIFLSQVLFSRNSIFWLWVCGLVSGVFFFCFLFYMHPW